MNQTALNGRCVIVLGMHRSGTSALTGFLRQCGLYLGEVLDDGIIHNPRGLQEAPSVLFMHQNLLEANSGDWCDPPEKVTWSRMHEAVRDLFIESRRERPIWGFKDPRTLLVLEGWLKVLPQAELAGVFRHPMEVALSLERRNGFPIEKGLELWRIYNERLAGWCEQRSAPLVAFSRPESAVRAAMSEVARRFDLDPERGTEFFDAGLRRMHAGPDETLPAAIEEVLERLERLAL